MASKVDGGLRGLLKANIKGPHWVPLETGAVVQGVPDTNGCLDGVEVWVECKKTDTNKVDLIPLQVQWLTKRGRAGGRVFVLVRKTHTGGPRKGPPVDELWLLDGRHADDVKENGLRSPYVVWHWATGCWKWDQLAGLLFGQTGLI